MSDCFDVVFLGRLKSGLSKHIVADNLRKNMGLPEAQVEKLFSGGKIVVKRGVSRDRAIALYSRLRREGLVMVVVDDQKKIVELVQTPPPPKPAQLEGNAFYLESIQDVEKTTPDSQDEPAENESIVQYDAVKKKAMALTVALSYVRSLLIPILVLVFGGGLIAYYSPFPDPVIRKGFALGVALMVWGGWSAIQRIREGFLYESI
ncbi:hypothetical protein [Agaribacterium haliotis]|uniref:hypothetical protein n=1 Tax=Agaribacterium haliotis TaxID=2013869 RepID=UPI00186416E1|nr:hypothetical protein [Agaribacterium haliotis]